MNAGQIVQFKLLNARKRPEEKLRTTTGIEPGKSVT